MILFSGRKSSTRLTLKKSKNSQVKVLSSMVSSLKELIGNLEEVMSKVTLSNRFWKNFIQYFQLCTSLLFSARISRLSQSMNAQFMSQQPVELLLCSLLDSSSKVKSRMLRSGSFLVQPFWWHQSEQFAQNSSTPRLSKVTHSFVRILEALSLRSQMCLACLPPLTID